MLYILLVDSSPQLSTVDHTAAQKAFADAAEHAPATAAIRLLQLQADCVQEQLPPAGKPANSKPLSDAEKRQLADLLARQNANAQKGGA